MNKSDKILVTGAAGMLGSTIVSQLDQHEFQFVDAVTRLGTPIDLRNGDAVKTYFGVTMPDHVIHCAARVYGIMGNMKNQGLSYYDNTLINTNVIEAAHYAGVKKITVMGTGAVYGTDAESPLSTADIFSGRPHDSESGYAHAKRGMLAMLEAYHDSYGMDYAFVVSCNLFGPHDKFDTENGHVVPALIKKFYDAKRDGTNVVIWGDGSAQRDFLYVEDAARVVRMVADTFTGPINMGSGSVWRIKEIVRVLSKITGLPSDRISWDPSKPNGQERRSYDLGDLTMLGFEPQWTIPQGLQETWEWYCNEHSK